MWARKSTDNGATWLADMTFSDVVSPLPGQPDPSIVAGYASDYDYGTALAGAHYSSWDDGRGHRRRTPAGCLLRPVASRGRWDSNTNSYGFTNPNGNSHGNSWSDPAQGPAEKGGGNKYGASQLERGNLGQRRHLPQ
jgi:hypothetical protein